MSKDLENAVNAWYKQWLLTNDPFKEDFEDELYKVLPNHKFTLDINNNYWHYLES